MLRTLKANRYLQLEPVEYWSDRVLAGYTTVTSGAGAFAYIDIYNDTVVGADLLLIGFTLATSVADTVSIFSRQGIGSAGIKPPPLYAQQAGLDGLIASGGTVTGPNANTYQIITSATPFVWPYDFPLTAIAPGFSLRFITNGAAETLRGSFIWLSEPAN